MCTWSFTWHKMIGRRIVCNKTIQTAHIFSIQLIKFAIITHSRYLQMKFNDENRMEVIGLQCMMFPLGLTVLIGTQLINLITRRVIWTTYLRTMSRNTTNPSLYGHVYFAAAFKNFPWHISVFSMEVVREENPWNKSLS